MARIELDNLTANNLELFNIISSNKPRDSKFIEQAKDSQDLAKYAYFGEVPVGVITAQSISENKDETITALSITHLAVLKAYSNHYNIERTLIQYILDLCPKRHVKKCYLIAEGSQWPSTDLLNDLGLHPCTPPSSLELEEGQIAYVT